MTAPASLQAVIDTLAELLGEDWHEGLALGPETSLLYDLELESIQVLELIAQLNERSPHASILSYWTERSKDKTRDLTLGELADWLGR